jgi:hypothetical protein
VDIWNKFINAWTSTLPEGGDPADAFGPPQLRAGSRSCGAAIGDQGRSRNGRIAGRINGVMATFILCMQLQPLCGQ